MTEIPQEWVDKGERAALRAGFPVGLQGAYAVLAVVLPDVRRQVADEIAAAIEAYAMEPEMTPGFDMSSALFSAMRAHEHAARLAREIGAAP